MDCKNDQRKDSCTKNFAICTVYEGAVPDYSGLKGQNCLSIEEVGEDIYTLVTELRDAIDVKELDFDCLTAPTELDISKVLQLLIQEICSLKLTVGNQEEAIETLQEQVSALQQQECP